MRTARASDDHTIAYHFTNRADNRPISDCAVVWLGGFHSDMSGTKALAVEAWCAQTGRAFVRFDYFGHGQSSGAFEDGDITRWCSDALTIIDEVIPGPLVLVGSSMGGWIALLAALKRAERVRGLVLIAPAPDFTNRLMWDQFDEDVRDEIMSNGKWLRPSAYGDAPYPITRRLIEDGRQNLLLDAPSIPVKIPVHILQGTNDQDVPWRHALEVAEKLESEEVVLSLIKDGDHRLSTPRDLKRLTHVVEAMCAACDHPVSLEDD